MSAKAIDQLSPLASDLREQNPDRYLATLFAPPARRASLFALYAFDNELARVQSVVTEPVAGLIRLQWWQDVIDGFGRDATVAHPVVQGLKHAVAQGGLDRAYLQRALEGRRKPFLDDLPWDERAFEQFLLDIGGSISCAAASLLGAREKTTLAIAGRVGLVGAALELLRHLERSTPDRQAWLQPTWLKGQDESSERPDAPVSAKLVDWAIRELAEARRQTPAIPRPLLAAFFPGTLAGVRLRDPTHGIKSSSLPSAVPRLIWCWLRGRF